MNESCVGRLNGRWSSTSPPVVELKIGPGYRFELWESIAPTSHAAAKSTIGKWRYDNAERILGFYRGRFTRQ